MFVFLKLHQHIRGAEMDKSRSSRGAKKSTPESGEGTTEGTPMIHVLERGVVASWDRFKEGTMLLP